MVYHDGACTAEETAYLESGCYFENRELPCLSSDSSTDTSTSGTCEYTDTRCVYDGIAFDTPPEAYANDCAHLQKHNEYRFLHENTPMMSLKTSLCNNAQTYAENLANTVEIQLFDQI